MSYRLHTIYEHEIQNINIIHTFSIGDMVSVHLRIKEGVKERIQIFEGLCIKRKGKGLSQTFVVRRTNTKGHMERIFPLLMPSIQSIVVKQSNKVRRAKLYYVRYLLWKKAREKKTS